MGWSDLAIQSRNLHPSRLAQVFDPLRFEWKSLVKPSWKQGIDTKFHKTITWIQEWQVKMLLPLTWGFLCVKTQNRLPSRRRKTMVKRKERLNGLQLKEPSMDFNHERRTSSSMKRIVTVNSLRLLNRLNAELRLPGKKLIHSIFSLFSIPPSLENSHNHTWAPPGFPPVSTRYFWFFRVGGFAKWWDVCLMISAGWES